MDAFSLGFGPELAHFVDRNGTRWRLAALPLGGYVRFHGDANGASEPDFDADVDMPETERAVSFFAQNVWKRAAVVAAGPIANFILAIVIFTALFYFEGRAVLAPRIESVIAGGRAAVAGFKKGDLVVSIDGAADRQLRGHAAHRFRFGRHAAAFRGRSATASEVTIDATPERKDTKTPFGVSRGGVLGVAAGGAPETGAGTL